MDSKTHLFYTRVLYIVLVLGVFLLLLNTSDRWIALSLYFIFAVLVLYHHKKFYTVEYKLPAGKVFLIVELILSLGVMYFDNTNFVELYFFIVLADCILAYSALFSGIFSLTAMILYASMLFYKSNTDFYGFWLYADSSIYVSILFLGIMYMAKYHIQQQMKMATFARELESKASELEVAYQKLQEYSDNLEKTAAVSERNRLFQEMHDKLGHILTTASIGAEVCAYLLDSDPKAAKERIKQVAQQIQSSMKTLRDVIHGTPPENLALKFTQRIEALICETMKRADVIIEYEIQETPDIGKKKEAILYNALMEGLTNGIKHGNASSFIFKLINTDSHVEFLLQDNGTGYDKLTPGYGLQKMKENIEGAGGRFIIDSRNGCSLRLTVPINKANEGGIIEQNQGSHS